MEFSINRLSDAKIKATLDEGLRQRKAVEYMAYPTANFYIKIFLSGGTFDFIVFLIEKSTSNMLRDQLSQIELFLQ